MKNRLLKYNYLIITAIMLMVNILLFIFTNKLNILPIKYYLLIFGIIVVLEIVSILFILLKKKILNIIGYILSIILIIVNICGIYYVRVTDNFLDKSFNNDNREYTTTFYIVSKKDSNNTLDNIVGKDIGYYKDTPNIEQAITELGYKYKVNTISYDNISEMFNGISYILVEKNLYDYTFEIDKSLNKSDYDIIYEYTLTFQETIDSNTEENDDNYIPETNNINIYIGGTDFTNQLYDFNMIVSINKDTHKVLLTSIPRDYHIPVYGKGGRSDNMGYHGAWSITTSMKSLEQLLNIKIDY